MIYDNKIILPSGRMIEADCGYLGIYIGGKDKQQNRFNISSGMDNHYSVFDSKEDVEYLYGEEYDDDSSTISGDLVLTTEDRKFLAELMIARWQEFGGIKGA